MCGEPVKTFEPVPDDLHLQFVRLLACCSKPYSSSRTEPYRMVTDIDCQCQTDSLLAVANAWQRKKGNATQI